MESEDSSTALALDNAQNAEELAVNETIPNRSKTEETKDTAISGAIDIGGLNDTNIGEQGALRHFLKLAL
jgi:hypothetical protein